MGREIDDTLSFWGIPYLNIDVIDYLYDKYELKKGKFNTSKTTFELSLFNTIKFSKAFVPEATNPIKEITDKFLILYKYLEKENKIIKTRPKAVNEVNGMIEAIELLKKGHISVSLEPIISKLPDFVEEEVIASKFIIPSKTLENVFGKDYMTVWIAEPEPDQLSNNPLFITGTFLYLIENIYDSDLMARHCISGCSALQMVSNIVLGKPYFQINEDEPLGRYSMKHPRKKIESLGACLVDKRKIKTLYKMRYMTNEQCYTYKKKKYTCNDLLGYPLIID